MRLLPMLLLAFFLSGTASAQTSKIYYVSPAGTGDGTSWDHTTTLASALLQAEAGDQIWVQGFEQISNTDQLYVPADASGFSVKSGVMLYGGFRGTETRLSDRETLGKPYQLKYRSVLSGDMNKDDASDEVNLIFPANMTRKDNATHVLSLNLSPTPESPNNNAYPTVVNGFSISGGQAAGTDADGQGGGIYIYGDNSQGGVFRIERCFLLNNYATRGGAIYVDGSVATVNNETSLVSQCVIYNNAAGERASLENEGGGAYLAGTAVVANTSVFNNENGGVRLSSGSKVVNSTIARNTGAGVDMTGPSGGHNVLNSVVWGNTALSAQYQPGFRNSAYHEVTADDKNHNIYVAKENRNGMAGPMFDSPSLNTSYDRDFNWRNTAYPIWSWNVLEGSVMIDKGDNDSYDSDAYGSEDMAGNSRISGSSICIGAYEYQNLPATRIRYVCEGGTGDGSSWENASGDLQKMIDELADNNVQNMAGEVWVAAGTYEPQVQLISGSTYSASFRMRDGISVYGGFAGNESDRQDREKGTMPWDFKHPTVLCGSAYADNLSWNSNRWTLTSESRHVVWFAPMPDEENTGFTRITTLDGVTIKGGYAQGGEGLDDFKTDCGAGVYMVQNAYLQHCIVTENTATGPGGAVYEKGGRVLYSLLYNNNSDSDGGAVYMDNAGIVLASMLTNNSASNGAGVYLSHNGPWVSDGMDHPEYLILSTSVVSNNTSRNNGAVYCDKGGVLLQNTITNNHCPTATDYTASNASQTGGLYVDSYALVVNSVLWNNTIQNRNVPMYAKNPTAQTVRFMHTALSGMNNAIWNNTLQQEIIQLSDDNDMMAENIISPDFTPDGLPVITGVDGSLKEVSYLWKPVNGSNLRAQGMTLGTFPSEVLLAPEMDIAGSLFAQKPAVGAYHVEAVDIHPADDGNSLKVYVNVDCTVHDHDGRSWDKGYRSLNEAIAYLAGLSKDEVNGRTLEVHVQEGDIWPRYAFTNLDPQTATIDIPATVSGQPIYIYGGYAADTHERTPLITRSVINGNHEGKNIEEGLYHCITVAKGAKAVIDGFHVVNGYAAGEASRQYGAGLLVHDGAEVTVRNCIFENNTAQEGAAVDARSATLIMENCVVNNNTNTDGHAAVVNGNDLTLNFTTLVQNVGMACSDGTRLNSSYATANTLGNTHTIEISTIQFANPTKNAGATLGYDTYLGGYSSFQPTNQNPVVNQGQDVAGINTDITFGARSRGGAPDLGAYEAELPVDGTVLYVRKGSAGSGSSWSDALGSITEALAKAISGQDIWVSAGEYEENLTMKEGVDVLGGFAATGSPDNKLDGVNRDISHKEEKFKTIIKGKEEYKFTPEQGSNPAGYTDRNKRVLTQQDEFDTQTMWEGFVITGGQTGLNEYGAGVKLMRNGHLKNCRIEGNRFYECGNIELQHRVWWSWNRESYLVEHDATNLTGGGGVYCQGGVVENCQIIKNILEGFKFDEYAIGSNYRYASTGNIYGKGAGLSISGGNIINCVIAQNVAGYNPELNPEPSANSLTNILGAAVFVQRTSNFYSSTIVENSGGWSDTGSPIIPGIWDESLAGGSGSYFYNCIIAGNYGYGNTKENFMQIGKGLDQAPENLEYSYFTLVKFNDGTQTPASVALADDRHNQYEDFGLYDVRDIDKYREAYANLHLLTDDYALNIVEGTNPCLNTGSEEFLKSEDNNINITQDADGYDRIQDCAVDMGAYESANDENLAFEQVAGTSDYVYYVTQNGSGLRSGSSLSDAACAMKLQQVLNHAGQTAMAHPESKVIVKVAGYEGASFTYHVNTLGDADDPQSYTYVIPYGVTVMGGYDGMAENWDDAARNPMKYKTVLSAVTGSSSLEQQVNGYHVISFGIKPEGWSGADSRTVVDGLVLTDGKATSLSAVSDKTRGGGAVVPSWGHVRNCIVSNCQAEKGGGLYLMPGAVVSGTALIGNMAEDGGGLYADDTGVASDRRARLVSCTVTDNTATSVGGGIYMEEGALMAMNTVVWGNTAPSDKNISGVVSSAFEDEVWSRALESSITAYYPFNHSFVETYDLPSNFENTSMESDNSYFANDERVLKTYSSLIKHGMDLKYQDGLVRELDVAEADMQGIQRNQSAMLRVDAGAYAFEGGVMPTDRLVRRIFVSQGANVQFSEVEDMDDYIGRSFYTSLTWLDDALEYIKAVRSNGVANEDTKFEILIAGGIYTPSYQRAGAASATVDQRQNSYVIPQGVSIYGGFSGEELYSSKADDQDDLIRIPGVSGSFDCNGNMTDMLENRATSDFNQNGIIEPWELASQTILSGHVNVSANVKNAYHVLFSTTEAPTARPVVLDGVTVMDGETSSTLSNVLDNDEMGRGGGVYSNGVSYLANRCRFINNFAVRGGAIYVRDARLTLINSLLAGNGMVDNPNTAGAEDLQPRGGAVYIAGVSRQPRIQPGLYAVNTLWVNNETGGQGGAIGTNSSDDIVEGVVPEVSLMNNTFALNKAMNNAVIFHHNGKNVITNTLMWGNLSAEGNIPQTDESNTSITHSASDVTDLSAYSPTNLKLSAVNTDVNGPRFAHPATVAGVAGNDANHLWNPSSISVLTDAGDGKETADGTSVSGAYEDWWSSNELTDYQSQYMGGENYRRYAGPRNEDGTQADKPIDIGVYEYQYNIKFPEMDAIYVATTESGLADGSSWANATSDLRGALVAMANPTGGQSKEKAVYIKAGNYSSSLLSTGISFPVHLGTTEYGTSLTIKGSYNESGVQDFSLPTVITTQDGQASQLMDITTQAGKTVSVEGLSFINTKADGGNGLRVSSQSGVMTLKQLAFRKNSGTGLQVASGNADKLLLANVLFADGGTGLAADGHTTVVNATFAQNKTADLTGDPVVYNSVAWNNGTQNLQNDGTCRNVAIAYTVANDDVQNGPNFRDPENGDYRIRPSVLLLDKGSKENYQIQVGVIDGEQDLANNARLTGDQIDVGAYEYEAPMKPIVYVKSDLMGAADGNSWTTALGDLQGAVDLAGIYANGHQGEHAYVFVHHNYQAASDDQLSLSMPGVKVYGGMNDETSFQTEAGGIVSDLLGKRKGMLEATGYSSLQDVTLGADVVVDGFVVNGRASVNNGVLSTCVVKGSVTGQADGMLYNSLALGDVTGVKAINVTATGNLDEVAEGSGNNRVSADENAYVTTGYWKYQLMETSPDIDPTETRTDISSYIEAVGHSRDLIGNKRIRNTVVDNGCFETWNITDNTLITAADKPIGQSVVYVRKAKELQIQKADDGTLVYPDGQYFSPGYLLLEHQAGLRGNGNYIKLTNFSVERNVAANDNDLAVMPFEVTDVTPDTGYRLMRYNGSARAAYDYTFDDQNGKAWEEVLSQPGGSTEGFLIASDHGVTIRFSGNSYSEGGADKSVVLMKYNFNDPWTSTTSSGNRFTHKENMSWNLFGSPYLCSMNYGDMAYGRVLYGYTDHMYKTVNTANETEGYIPAGDAVFTQTATLRERESVSIALPSSSGRQGDAYASSASLQLSLSTAEASRDTASGTPAADLLLLNAVPADEARQDFDLGADGVKWMSTAAVPQLYAVRGNSRYSLLSAVSEEGETPLGVTASKAGTYQLGIAGNEGYETVELTDHLTGRTVDLTAAPYTFTLPADTCIDQRFTLRFRTLSDEKAADGIRIRLQADGSICVSGLEPGQRVQAYSVAGQLESTHVATGNQCVFRLQHGVHVIEVSEGGTRCAACKLMVP